MAKLTKTEEINSQTPAICIKKKTESKMERRDRIARECEALVTRIEA